MQADVDCAAAASGTPDVTLVSSEHEEGDEEVPACEESGGTSVPTWAEEDTIEIFDVDGMGWFGLAFLCFFQYKKNKLYILLYIYISNF